MNYSSIIKKPCKAGCGCPPKIGLQGYCANCRPDLVAAVIKKQNAKQYQKGKLSKAYREQMQDGNFDEASMQAIKNDLDFVASRICRLTASDNNGQVQCYTCTTKKHWTLMQAGHFISRSCMLLRWDLRRNIRPQCNHCNSKMGLDGNLSVFEANLELEQQNLPSLLKELSREPYKHSQEELKGLLNQLRQQLRIIEATKK